MLQENRLGGKGGSHFCQRQEGIEQEDDEDGTASGKGTCGSVGHLEEQASDDQSLGFLSVENVVGNNA